MTTAKSTNPIPRGVLDQHIAVLGKTRSGKSTVMRGLVEDLLDRDKPVCIIDPKGDWWGIKLARDGKGPGYPVVIFGGPHADVPINEHAGAHVAELFATGNRPCLIDLRGWMPGERTRFWVAFASTLFRLTKGMRWLAIDEVHNFAPKGKIMDPDSGKALHWANRLASEGLGMGIAMLFASQRPQKVHNDLLTSAETLIAMRVLHPSDREAVTDWIRGCGDPVLGAQVLGTLAQMDRGEGWAWSPEIGFGPERVKFPMFRTYDSFRPQTAEDAKGLKGWAEVNLEDVKAKLADVVKEAEANDPARLRKTIAELERRLAKAPVAREIDSLALELAQAHERMAGMAEESARVVAENDMLRQRIRVLAESASQASERVQQIGAELDALATSPPPALGQMPPPPSRASIPEPRRPPPPPKPVATNGHAPAAPRVDGINGPQQRILDALAWWESVKVMMPTRLQVAVVADYSPTGGAFQNPLGALRTGGLVDYPQAGAVSLTDAGRAAANPPPRAGTNATLHEKIMAILDGPRRRILTPLLEAYPDALSREDLATAAGYEPSGGAFQNPLGALRSLGLVTYPGKGIVRAEPVLFIGGRR